MTVRDMPFHICLTKSMRLSRYCMDTDRLFKSLQQNLGGIKILCSEKSELLEFSILGI